MNIYVCMPVYDANILLIFPNNFYINLHLKNFKVGVFIQIWHYTDSKSIIVKKLDENENAVIWNYRKSQKVILVMNKLLKQTEFKYNWFMKTG